MHSRKSNGVAVGKWSIPLDTIQAEEFLGKYIDHVRKNDVDIFSSFLAESRLILDEIYSIYDDESLIKLVVRNSDDYKILSLYMGLKDSVCRIADYESFTESITPDSIIIICDFIKLIIDSGILNSDDNEIDTSDILAILDSKEFSGIMASVDHRETDESVDMNEDINLYSDVNIINNNDNSDDNVEDTFENDESNSNEEDDVDMYGVQILEAIEKLTEVTTRNNALISKQNELLEFYGSKLDEINENTAPVNLEECVEVNRIEEVLPYTVQPASNPENDTIILFNIEDLRDKNIVVTSGNKAVVTNLVDIVEDAIRNTPGSDMIKLTGSKSDSL